MNNTPTLLQKEKLSLWHILGSAIAAMFGVQSSKNRERDFAQGKPMTFVMVGILMTILFIATVIAVVQLVLKYAQ